ncbi:MAG: mannosyltransferase [Chloroflexia bacterium]|jgi:4-amino-4-deoxy-L-arabinose transferase-like glycosyltransferase|nr:mannosyltransferase [Chloroflexia bacterium]
MKSLELDIPNTSAQATTQELVHAGAANEALNAAALLSVVLLGLVLRVYGLADHGIWFDEAYHIQLVSLPSAGDMLSAVLANPPSDPLYVLLLRPWVASFGHGDAAVRALSVLLSTATLPATYWLGKVAAGRAAGLLGALLLAVSPYALEFGQQASLYVLASLTTTLALAAGLKWRNTSSKRNALLYIALGSVAIYTHYVVAAILAIFCLLALHKAAGPGHVTRRAWIAAHAAILLAWLPWLLALLTSWVATPVPRATLRNPATVEQVIGGLVQFTSGTASLLQGARVPEVLGLVAGGLLLLGGWAAGREVGKRGLRVICVTSGLIFLLPAGVSAVTGLWLFVPHFMVFLLPALFVTCSAGLLHLGRAGWQMPGWSAPALRQYLAPGLGVAWLIAQVWGLALYYRYPPHGADGLRELAATLSQRAQPSDVVLVTPPVLQISIAQYYPGQTYGLPDDFDLYRIYQPYAPAVWHDRSLAVFNSQSSGHGRVWLVYRPELDEGGRLLGEVARRYQQVEEYRFVFATLYLFEAP